MAVIELATSVSAFWAATGAVFRAQNPRTSDSKDNRMTEALIRLPHARVTWLVAIFLLGYVGIEVALGGWIVKFMLEVRNAEDFASGMTATGFWMGITVGRIVLGFVTPRLGEKLAIAVGLSAPFLAPSYGSVKLTYRLPSDLSSPYHGPRTDILARPPILRLSRRRLPARLLSRASFPCRRRRCY